MSKGILVALIFVSLMVSSHASPTENIFTEHLLEFDKYQSELNLEKSIPYLSKNVSIEITTCENKVEKFDMESFVSTYSSIQEHANSLSISRDIIRLENCDFGSGCTIHSRLKERLVAYEGRYDKTTISSDETKIEIVNGYPKIKNIQAKVKCD